MERLLYISECQIDETNAQQAILQIVARAVRKNAEASLTGALLFTGTHFAQILEGSRHSIDQLMLAIYSDTRHKNIRIVDRSAIAARRFPDWGMAYSGPSQFVSRHVDRLLNDISQSERLRATEWLTELAYQFSLARTDDHESSY